MTSFSFYRFLFTLYIFIDVVKSDKIIVKSKVGLIKGLRARDGNYSMYLGIPYAKVNISNPFGESLPYPHFETKFNAIDDSGICPQEEEVNHTIVGSLDCLHINIYVPDVINKTSQLPVLVYIYGGFIKFGSAGRFLYGPKYIVEHDVILVTFNYRVGPYGFLCLSIPEVSGNQGIKDQIKALKWIKRNIKDFGGDPKKITVGGNSSGAMSLDYILHTLTGDEELFDKIILQSGNVYSTGIEPHAPDDSVPIKLANKLGYNISSLEDALHYLTITDTKLVINASLGIDVTYNTCLENSFEGVQKVASGYPINLKVPVVKDKPILIGNTNAETQFFYEPLTTSNMKQMDLFISGLGLDVNNDTYLNEMKNIVYKFYFGEQEQSLSVKSETIKFASDFYYYYGSKRIMKKYLENGAKNIYYYIFSYDGERNYLKFKIKLSEPGASHADELGYLFDISLFNFENSANDTLMIERMTTLWTNFVKYGNPTPTTTELLPVKWLPYRLDKQYYMNIDLKLSLKKAPYSRRMAFWDLFYDINRKYMIGYKEADNSLNISTIKPENKTRINR